MLCGGSGSGHQEDSASPWQAGDLQMGAHPSFHAPLLEFGLNFGAVFIQGCLSLCMWVLPATAEM